MVSSAPLKHFRILYSAIFIAAVIPREYEDFSEEFRASNGSAVGANSFYYQTFETCSFRNKYFYNGFVKDSLFRDVSFRNMYFHYARFENVTFENVRFEWTEDWYMRAELLTAVSSTLCLWEPISSTPHSTAAALKVVLNMTVLTQE